MSLSAALHPFSRNPRAAEELLRAAAPRCRPVADDAGLRRMAGRNGLKASSPVGPVHLGFALHRQYLLGRVAHRFEIGDSATKAAAASSRSLQQLLYLEADFLDFGDGRRIAGLGSMPKRGVMVGRPRPPRESQKASPFGMLLILPLLSTIFSRDPRSLGSACFEKILGIDIASDRFPADRQRRRESQDRHDREQQQRRPEPKIFADEREEIKA